MSLDLLNELEKRVQSAVGTIEDLKQEIEQLKEENAALASEKSAWEGRLAELLGKFDLIDSGDHSESADAGEAATEADDTAFSSDEASLTEQAFAQDLTDDSAEESHTPEQNSSF